MSKPKPKILIVDVFGIGVDYNIAEGEENFSRETRTGLERMRIIFEQAGRANFAKGLLTPDQFLDALNERLRKPITMLEMISLWTSTYEVRHDFRGELCASGMPPYVWSSDGNDVDFAWLRAHRLHKWSGCRGMFMSGPGRIKSRPAYYEVLRHDLSKELCEDLAFSDMVMIDSSIESVGCARSLGIDARVFSPFGVRDMLQELRTRM